LNLLVLSSNMFSAVIMFTYPLLKITI
jgi:hypothetical protein